MHVMLWNDVKLLFGSEPDCDGKPVIACAPANSAHCLNHEACCHTLRLAQDFVNHGSDGDDENDTTNIDTNKRVTVEEERSATATATIINADEIVMDMEMSHHTPSHNAFCDDWKHVNGDDGENLLSSLQNKMQNLNDASGVIPHGPAATTHVAFMQSSGFANDLHSFLDQTMHGSKEMFTKIQEDVDVPKEEKEKTDNSSTNDVDAHDRIETMSMS